MATLDQDLKNLINNAAEQQSLGALATIATNTTPTTPTA